MQLNEIQPLALHRGYYPKVISTFLDVINTNMIIKGLHKLYM